MSSSTFFSSVSGMLVCCSRCSRRAICSSIFSTVVYSILPFMPRTCMRSASRALLALSSSARTACFCACDRRTVASSYTVAASQVRGTPSL